MAKLPWFPFYPADFLGAEKVQLMTNEQVGMYVKLLCYQWMEGSIPEKSSSAIAVLRLGWGDASEMTDFQDVLTNCFIKHPTEKGRLINKRLDEIRREQEEISIKKQEAGRAGGYAKARLAALGSCQDSATGKSVAKSSYSESKPKSESNSKRKERREKRAASPSALDRLESFVITPDLEEWGTKQGVPNLGEYLDEFKDYWRSVGGKRKNGQSVVDWAATFRNRIHDLRAANKLKTVNVWGD